MGGRLTLIIATLSNLPVYYMSLYHKPKAVVRGPETILASFLWGDRKGERRYHIVKWETMK